MCRHLYIPVRFLAPLLLSLLLLSPGTARANRITGAEWKGTDFIVTFSDSASYRLDLVASDSTQLVIRVDDAMLAGGLRSDTDIPGPEGRKGVLTRNSDGTVRLTILDTGRLGYSTLWRPYSHRLVVHTFHWGKLGYAEEQYHKGLIALEQGLNREAEELLSVAYATGEQRAGSVLGTYYARQGKDSEASRYLQSPLDADDYAAQAELQRQKGDSIAARTQQQQFDQMLANDTSARATDTTATRKSTEKGMGIDVLGDPRVIGIGLGVLLLVVLLITWSVRRGSRLDREKAERSRASEEPLREPIEPRVPPVEKEARVVERPEPAAPEPVPVSPVEQAPVEPEAVPAPAVTPVEPVRKRPTAFTRAGMFRESSRAAQPEIDQKPAPVLPEEPAHEVVAEHEPLRDPELQQVEETTERQEIFVRQAPSSEPAVEQREEPEIQTSPAAAEVEAPQPVPAAAGEPSTRQRVLSTQAREVQRKIQSRRPDQPAPAEPTKSAARRLNISRDNVELRRMMEETKKKERK